MSKTPISADSHITEPPNCYIDYIESKYRDVAPHIVDDPKKGEIYVIEVNPRASRVEQAN